MGDFISFVQLRKKHSLRSVSFSKVAAWSLLKLKVESCNFITSNSLTCVFFTFFKLCKWRHTMYFPVLRFLSSLRYVFYEFNYRDGCIRGKSKYFQPFLGSSKNVIEISRKIGLKTTDIIQINPTYYITLKNN